MKHYYALQTERWLTEDEQSRFHLDYNPQDTRQQAISELQKFLIRGIKTYWEAVQWRLELLSKSFDP